MKKYFFFAAAAIVAASCAKTPAPVQTPDGPEAPAVEGKVAVQFGTNISANVETKAAVAGWAEQDLYIYGFQRIQNAEGNTVIDYESLVEGQSTPFIKNVKAKAPEATTDPDTPVLSGKIEVKNNEGQPFYYSGTTTYDFFGYYVQDAAGVAPEPKLNDNKDAYVLPITIDGTQDIMTAVADHTYACDKVFGAEPGSSRPQTGWKDDYAFSAYAARRGVHPYLVFKHELTQLNFKVTSGTKFTTETQLHVTDVTIKAVPSKATLRVAGATPGVTVDMTSSETETNSIVDLKVKKSDDADLEPVKVPTATGDAAPYTPADAVPVGQSVMLFPDDEFVVWITIAQGITETNSTPTASEVIKRTINISEISQASGLSLTKFDAGYAYDITFKVYGLESVDITAELTKWKEGGSIEINTDDEPTIF